MWLIHALGERVQKKLTMVAMWLLHALGKRLQKKSHDGGNVAAPCAR
jgi:hypothetical protein